MLLLYYYDWVSTPASPPIRAAAYGPPSEGSGTLLREGSGTYSARPRVVTSYGGARPSWGPHPGLPWSQRPLQEDLSRYAENQPYHHNVVWHESTRPQIHRFRPQARAPPLGVSLPHQRCGDGEVSGSGVSEGVCEAPTFWSCPRLWCRPTLKVAATPCRCASTTIRLCESATLSGWQRLKEHGARDCPGRFG